MSRFQERKIDYKNAYTKLEEALSKEITKDLSEKNFASYYRWCIT